jgi:3-oxoacyl-[acyl-carrier protein] reductase
VDDSQFLVVKEVKERTAGKLNKIEYINCDISDHEEVEKVWRRLLKTYGCVNILVNNAARTLGKRVRDLTFADYKKTMEVNFLSIV